MSEITPTPDHQAEALSEKNASMAKDSAGLNNANGEQYSTREEVIARLKEVITKPVNEVKAEVDHLKSAFYKIRRAEVDALRTAFLQQGGKLEDFIPINDNMEEELKELLNEFRKKRQSYNEASQEIRENNYKTRIEILERIKTIVDGGEDVGKCYPEFQQLRQRWNEAENVPEKDADRLWKEFQNYVERFYDLLKINKELREYDFKKNWELKTALCEAVEKLATEEDVLSAFHSLQKLHSEWRNLGPVAKEKREEIWSRFKTASSVINKRHQAFFEQKHGNELENEKIKREFCEKVEAMDFTSITNVAKWEEVTKEIIDLQAQWKALGRAPKKVNGELFDRFRKVCDDFFIKKTAFFKDMRENYEANMVAKTKLCEEAEALKDSEDWKSTTDKLVALQEEWKKIGLVPRKYSDDLWKRFVTACNTFFDRRKTFENERKSTEKANLQAKRAAIEKLKSLNENLPKEEIISLIKGIITEFNSIGHVPFKDKEKIYDEFNSLVDEYFDKFDISASKLRLKNYKDNISERLSKGSQEVDGVRGERRRLLRQLENMKNDLSNYETNMNFFNFSSKKSNKLKEEMERNVERLRKDIALVEDKIRTISDALEAPSNPSEKG